MNVDLPKDAVTRVNESMRSIRGNYGNAAGLNFTFFIADRDPGRAFDDEGDFDVRMFMQRRTLPRLGGKWRKAHLAFGRRTHATFQQKAIARDPENSYFWN